MRLHRLKVTNFRGVATSEFAFGPCGVTVVEGPNETGKSSVLEALDLLLDELDSSKKQRVLATKPVHLDAGAEVEAEIESGPYRFVYTKRFHKKPATELRILAPSPANLAGREAHERVQQILAETADLGLWRALRLDQGGSLAPADLTERRWLSAALERAAGGAPASDGEDTLLAAAEQEFLRHFTASGAERRDVGELADRAKQAADALAETRTEERRVEDDVERAARLDADVRRAEISVADQRRRVTEHDARLRSVETLRTAHVRAKSARDAAQRALEDALRAVEERTNVAGAAEAALRELADAQRGVDDAAPGIEALRQELAAAEAAHAAARAAADAAVKARDLGVRDLDHRRSEIEHAQLAQRLARIEKAEREAQDAAKVVAANSVDDARLKTLRALRDEVVRAEAVMKAAGGALRITAHARIDAAIDGARVTLGAGELREGATQIDVPGVVSVELVAGSGVQKPKQEHEKKRDAYRAALDEHGADGLEAAIALHAAREDATRALSRRDDVLREALADLTRERLVHKIASLAKRLGAWPAERPAEPALPPTFDDAQEALRRAESGAADGTKASSAAETRLGDARRRHDDALQGLRRHEGALAPRKERAEKEKRRLDDARTAASDDDLARRRDASATAAADAEGACAAAAKALDDAGAEHLEALAQTARASLAAEEERLRRNDDELRSLRASLEARGDLGYAERAAVQERESETLRRTLAARRTAAAAAKRLHETLREEHDRVRARYVAPLREKIESLGRIVFGSTLRIELSDDLGIVSRTLDGRTVPFESLSGGAKEQLGVIARLAVAQIVEPEGGVPVILDDALGWSDPRRLEEMGALLAVAGRTSQVIVLTCQPDRYRACGGTTVRLG